MCGRSFIRQREGVREMRRSLVAVFVMIIITVAVSATEVAALSSWSLLTEHEWGPELFGFDMPLGNNRAGDSFFLGAERRWNGRFSGFVGLAVDDNEFPGFRDNRSMLAGFIYDAAPGISLSLEFQKSGAEDLFNEPEDRVVTFRTVITF